MWIAAIELGLIDRIRLVPTILALTSPNASKNSPLRKLPALILDHGNVVVDSLTIADYLDDLAGGEADPGFRLRALATP